MLNDLAILFGAIGTGLLALDAVKPRFLKSSKELLAKVASHDLSPLILFRSNYDDRDYEALSVIKAVGFYVSLVSLILIYFIYQPSDELIQKIAYYPLSAIALMFMGYFLANFRLGGWLIAIATYMVTPLILAFLFVFSALSWCLQLPIKAAVHNEEKWFGEDQAPRVLGYGLLFSSFIFQFIALKS
jgi:hypothetical protein